MSTAKFTAEALIALSRCQQLEVSPDGSWAVVVVERRSDAKGGADYVSDLWRLPLDGQSAAQQLTQGDSSDRAPAFDARGRLLFLSDRKPPGESKDNAKRSQIWALPEHGEASMVTDEPLGVTGFVTARARDRFVVKAPRLLEVEESEQRERAERLSERGPSVQRYMRTPVRYWDHWLRSDRLEHLVLYEDDAPIRDLLPEGSDRFRYHLASWALSPEGDALYMQSAYRGPDRTGRSQIERIDCESGACRALTARSAHFLGDLQLSPDGTRLACRREDRRERAPKLGVSEILIIELEGETIEHSYGDPQGRRLDLQGWCPEGRHLICVGDEQGARPVFALDRIEGQLRRLTSEASAGSHGSCRVSASGVVVGLRSRVVHPPEPFQVALQEDQQPELLANLSGWDPAEGLEAFTLESHLAPSAEVGQPCPYLFLRAGEREGPALMWIHGGPIGAWGDGWHWRWNPLIAASAGYHVVMPNPRGSTGYGQDWIEGIWGNVWGEDCFADLMAVTDAVAAREDVVEDKIIAMGGSFGGYMTNWIGTQTDRFAALITHACIFDFRQFYHTTDFPAWWLRALALYEPQNQDRANQEAWSRYSPQAHVEGWRSPTLIIHGARDYRTPLGEALALFESLELREVDVEMMIFEDENHWILRPQNIVAWYEGVLEFMERKLEKAQA